MIGVMRFFCLAFAVMLPWFVWSGVQVSSARGASEIMETMVDPSANFIWKSVSSIVTAGGVKETFPRTDKEWDDVRRAASRLAEGGRLLKQVQQRRRPQDEWLKWSQAIVDRKSTRLNSSHRL